MKKYILWTLALIITLAAAIYQRHTGPTYPKELSIYVNNMRYELSLVRSLALDEAPEVKLNISDTTLRAKLFFKRLNSSDEYQKVDFKYRSEPKKSGFFAEVTQQPAAGKLQYYFEITDSVGTQVYLQDAPIVIRFKGGVPLFILLPHILFMFVAMLFSTLAGLMAAVKLPQYKEYGIITLILLAVGGLILGPIVQHYAFGEFWTGIPFGWDLTDNKTLIASIFWIIAVVINRKQQKPLFTVLAAFILLIVFSIPHSLFGSQLDYTTGQVTQGLIFNFL